MSSRYTEISMRYAEETAGLKGVVSADLESGSVTIWSADDPKGIVTIEGDDFDSFLNCVLDIKAKRDEGGRVALKA